MIQEDIIQCILLHLDYLELIRCKLISKSWESLLSNSLLLHSYRVFILSLVSSILVCTSLIVGSFTPVPNPPESTTI